MFYRLKLASGKGVLIHTVHCPALFCILGTWFSPGTDKYVRAGYVFKFFSEYFYFRHGASPQYNAAGKAGTYKKPVPFAVAFNFLNEGT
jgi:hypothetical protein